jgi:hypothetical protein
MISSQASALKGLEAQTVFLRRIFSTLAADPDSFKHLAAAVSDDPLTPYLKDPNMISFLEDLGLESAVASAKEASTHSFLVSGPPVPLVEAVLVLGPTPEQAVEELARITLEHADPSAAGARSAGSNEVPCSVLAHFASSTTSPSSAAAASGHNAAHPGSPAAHAVSYTVSAEEAASIASMACSEERRWRYLSGHEATK